ncbi:hypothetical protein EDC01DRAFT_650509 [Geopyxis carbonaria]|nr:hypothetical protein EDC01DRAFT_650509 [Geopyxis carbonaria]
MSSRFHPKELADVPPPCPGMVEIDIVGNLENINLAQAKSLCKFLNDLDEVLKPIPIEETPLRLCHCHTGNSRSKDCSLTFYEAVGVVNNLDLLYYAKINQRYDILQEIFKMAPNVDECSRLVSSKPRCLSATVWKELQNLYHAVLLDSSVSLELQIAIANAWKEQHMEGIPLAVPSLRKKDGTSRIVTTKFTNLVWRLLCAIPIQPPLPPLDSQDPIIITKPIAQKGGALATLGFGAENIQIEPSDSLHHKNLSDVLYQFRSTRDVLLACTRCAHVRTAWDRFLLLLHYFPTENLPSKKLALWSLEDKNLTVLIGYVTLPPSYSGIEQVFRYPPPAKFPGRLVPLGTVLPRTVTYQDSYPGPPKAPVIAPPETTELWKKCEDFQKRAEASVRTWKGMQQMRDNFYAYSANPKEMKTHLDQLEKGQTIGPPPELKQTVTNINEEVGKEEEEEDGDQETEKEKEKEKEEIAPEPIALQPEIAKKKKAQAAKKKKKNSRRQK